MARQFAGRRQEKDWVSIPGIEVDMTAAGTFQGASFAAGSSVTVLRMLGSYVLAPTDGGTFAAGDSATITVAIGVVSSDAFAAGAASMPDPAGEPGYPWLFWKSSPLFFHSTNASVLGATPLMPRIDFDIRSMRKMKSGQSLTMVLEYSDVSGTLPLMASIGLTRVLLGGV